MSKILLIDDDDDVRYALVKFLRRAGHEVTESINGGKLKSLIEENQFDVVITDIIMPDTDGMEVIMNITQYKPELPVIAISGGGRIGQAEYLDVAKSMGAIAALQKPLDLDGLDQLIRKHAGK